MKKYSRGMASFVVMMMLSPVAAQAADGKVTFNGEVIENTCTVVNKDKTVTLPTVQRSALSSAGETAGVVPFTIDLTSCTQELMSRCTSRKINTFPRRVD